jgi:hypothetical protein
MKVTIPKATYELVRHDYSYRTKGLIDLKGKEELEAKFKGTAITNLARTTA